MATLNYRHFGNPGGSYYRAHYSTQAIYLLHSLAFLPFLSSTVRVRKHSAGELQFYRPRGGGWPRISRGRFFYFNHIFIDAICTCMQNFIKIDRKKKTFLYNWRT